MMMVKDFVAGWELCRLFMAQHREVVNNPTVRRSNRAKDDRALVGQCVAAYMQEILCRANPGETVPFVPFSAVEKFAAIVMAAPNNERDDFAFLVNAVIEGMMRAEKYEKLPNKLTLHTVHLKHHLRYHDVARILTDYKNGSSVTIWLEPLGELPTDRIDDLRACLVSYIKGNQDIRKVEVWRGEYQLFALNEHHAG